MTDARSIISETPIVDHPSSTILDDIDEAELQQRIENFEREINELKFENGIFESILERKKADPIVHHVPSAVPPSSTSQTLAPSGSNQDVTSNSATSRADRLARKRSRSRSTQSDIRVQLTIEQKLHFIMSEYEQIKNEKFRHQIKREKEIDLFESDREWIETEVIDSELAMADFLRLRDSSIEKYTKNLIGEKFVRYFSDRLKGRESLNNKLRDRSSGFKRQILRLENQIRQNEEMGDALKEIDFHQLKIENKQYLDKIDEKNIELVLLKRQVTRFTQLFNYYKDALHVKTQDLIDIQKRIDKQQNLLEYSEREISAANHEKIRVAKKHSYLVEQTETYDVPEILDYVRKKALLYNLQRDCEVWQRKLDIASIGFQQLKQEWLALQRNARYLNNGAN